MKYLLFMLLAVSLDAAAQQVHTDEYYRTHPVWIAMMRDTSANYFLTEKAFSLYWEERDVPQGEHDEIGERRERKKMPSRRQQRKIQQENQMRRAVKEYHFWCRSVWPYIQTDGRIATPHERLLIWKQINQR
ncbi:MAG: hypothetical protein EOP49_04250 [Sphingobacteriales bacterium]|nr:MAG: hypothetical protein EOP49_04250 [Sphingobacteriales bacterium]